MFSFLVISDKSLQLWHHISHLWHHISHSNSFAVIDGVGIKWKYGDRAVKGIDTFEACQTWCLGKFDCGSVYFNYRKNQCWKFNRKRSCDPLRAWAGVYIHARKIDTCGEKSPLVKILFYVQTRCTD